MYNHKRGVPGASEHPARNQRRPGYRYATAGTAFIQITLRASIRFCPERAVRPRLRRQEQGRPGGCVIISSGRGAFGEQSFGVEQQGALRGRDDALRRAACSVFYSRGVRLRSSRWRACRGNIRIRHIQCGKHAMRRSWGRWPEWVS